MCSGGHTVTGGSYVFCWCRRLIIHRAVCLFFSWNVEESSAWIRPACRPFCCRWPSHRAVPGFVRPFTASLRQTRAKKFCVEQMGFSGTFFFLGRITTGDTWSNTEPLLKARMQELWALYVLRWSKVKLVLVCWGLCLSSLLTYLLLLVSGFCTDLIPNQDSLSPVDVSTLSHRSCHRWQQNNTRSLNIPNYLTVDANNVIPSNSDAKERGFALMCKHLSVKPLFSTSESVEITCNGKTVEELR